MSDRAEVVVYGTSWCPDCDRVKRFLLERDADFRYVDIDADESATEEVIRLAGGKRVIPVVRIGDEVLVDPDNPTLGKRLGMDDADREVAIWDVLIVGAGMTGLSSAIYTTRERLTTVLVERAVPGGQIMTTAAVENYPGFPEPLSGAELTDRLVTQAEQFGARIDQLTEVASLEKRGDCFHVGATKDGDSLSYRARTVILAPGSQYRKLGVPGEKEYTGFGVSYCGTCDAPFYRDKHVVAVGGGNTAVDEGLHLLKFVKHLTVVNNLAELTASPFLVEELMKNRDQVELIGRSTVTEIRGDGKHRVTGVVIQDLESGQAHELACDGVFVWIGMIPNTDFLRGTVELDAQGFIIADNCNMATTTPGLFACGDVRSGSKKQIATAAGEGVIASLVASEYLKRQKTSGA